VVKNVKSAFDFNENYFLENGPTMSSSSLPTREPRRQEQAVNSASRHANKYDIVKQEPDTGFQRSENKPAAAVLQQNMLLPSPTPLGIA
jgi:hypothetical protein